MAVQKQLKNSVGSARLHDFSPHMDEDHALLLGEMKAIEEAINLLREDDREDSHVLPVLVRLRQYFLSDLLPHLHKEGEPAEESVVGIVLTVLSLAVMPGLGWAKLKTAAC